MLSLLYGGDCDLALCLSLLCRGDRVLTLCLASCVEMVVLERGVVHSKFVIANFSVEVTFVGVLCGRSGNPSV